MGANGDGSAEVSFSIATSIITTITFITIITNFAITAIIANVAIFTSITAITIRARIVVGGAGGGRRHHCSRSISSRCGGSSKTG